ncbi:hypothetical protein D3C71_1610380 [compost metagenome]
MATLIQHPDRHRQAVSQRAEARLAFGQFHLDVLAVGDVEEHHGHQMLVRLAHADRFHRVPPVQRARFHLELFGLPATRHLAIGAVPVGFMAGLQAAHPLPAGIVEPRIARKRLVDLDKPVVHTHPGIIEDHFDDAEPRIQALKYRAIQGRIRR